jgi:putative nucleotidyltransferase with HDIG domain
MAKQSSSSPSLLRTAALLHDIGSLGLQLTSRNEYSTLTELKLTEIHEVLLFEQMLFGMNHCEAGAALARRWRFPESLAHQIRVHHDHSAPSADSMTVLVQAACRMAETLGHPESALAPDAPRLQLEAVTPQQFRASSAFTADRLTGVVSASLEAAAGLAK